MQNSDINRIWDEIQIAADDPSYKIQRIVYLGLLFRAYVGLKSIPRKKYLILELPLKYSDEFKGFKETKGLELSVYKSGSEKPGFITCELTSSSSEMNDIFTIVAQDILNELKYCFEEDAFINTMKTTINRWKLFFEEKPSEILTGIEAKGLFGELVFMEKLLRSGCSEAEKMWNGPMKTAQDFQTSLLASEIKTTKANTINEVTISNLAQLDKENRDHLFLGVYRLEEDDANGMAIPQMVDTISAMLPREDLGAFVFKLQARGFNKDQAELYTEKYAVREEKYYEIHDDFPCLTYGKVSSSITQARYTLSLKNCEKYTVDFSQIKKEYLRLEYGS